MNYQKKYIKYFVKYHTKGGSFQQIKDYVSLDDSLSSRELDKLSVIEKSPKLNTKTVIKNRIINNLEIVKKYRIIVNKLLQDKPYLIYKLNKIYQESQDYGRSHDYEVLSLINSYSKDYIELINNIQLIRVIDSYQELLRDLENLDQNQAQEKYDKIRHDQNLALEIEPSYLIQDIYNFIDDPRLFIKNIYSELPDQDF